MHVTSGSMAMKENSKLVLYHQNSLCRCPLLGSLNHTTDIVYNTLRTAPGSNTQ